MVSAPAGGNGSLRIPRTARTTRWLFLDTAHRPGAGYFPPGRRSESGCAFAGVGVLHVHADIGVRFGDGGRHRRQCAAFAVASTVIGTPNRRGSTRSHSTSSWRSSSMRASVSSRGREPSGLALLITPAMRSPNRVAAGNCTAAPSLPRIITGPARTSSPSASPVSSSRRLATTISNLLRRCRFPSAHRWISGLFRRIRANTPARCRWRPPTTAGGQRLHGLFEQTLRPGGRLRRLQAFR